jgi:deoxyribodipyrimidine photolyase
MQKEKLVIYWSRRDFRTVDNPALFYAIEFAQKNNIKFLPLFIIEPYMTGNTIGKNNYANFGLPQRQIVQEILPRVIEEHTEFLLLYGNAAESIIELSNIYTLTIFVNEDVYRDFYKQIEKLKKHNIDIRVKEDRLTVNKETKTGSGNYYSVFTPFKNAVWQEFVNAAVLGKPHFNTINYLPVAVLEKKLQRNPETKYHFEIINTKDAEITKNSLEKIFTKNRIFKAGPYEFDIDHILKEAEIPSKKYELPYASESSAQKHFTNFLKNKIDNYKDARDMLDTNGISGMSLALSWGLVSARWLVKEIKNHYNSKFENPQSDMHTGAMHYMSELIWREFYAYLLQRKPELMHTEFQEKFRKNIAWAQDEIAKERFIKWICGKTGYSIVDAAMNELRETGFMHNRARMIVASVLTKNLGVDWKWGQEYFRAMLLDLDEASNNGGWQWGASVGADPKPIRIFNPHLQAKNYDPDGVYQKKWLGDAYFFPAPEIIPHEKAREDALRRYKLGTNAPKRDY